MSRRTLAVIAGLYVIEGYPLGVFRDVWPVYLREQGVSLAAIGAVSGLYFAWSAKFAWSPLVDRFGEFRGWICGALLAMCASTWALAGSAPEHVGVWLWMVLAVFCIGSATQDIAIDAYTIGIVERGQEGQANAVRITAYRLGLVLSGNGLLLIAAAAGWAAAWHASAVLLAAMAVSLWWWTPRVAFAPDARRDLGGAMRRWLGREGALPVLGFVLLYRVGDIALAPMLKPFWVDRGLSKAEIAWVSTTAGAVATVLGAWVGGAIVSRLGIGR